MNANTPTQANLERRRRRRANSSSMADTLDITQAKLEPLQSEVTPSAPIMDDAEPIEATKPVLSSSGDNAPEGLGAKGASDEHRVSRSELPLEAARTVAVDASRHGVTGNTTDRDAENVEERSKAPTIGSRTAGGPSEENMVKMSTRLPGNANRLMKAIALREGMTLADLTRDMIDRDLERRGFPAIAKIAACTDDEVNDLVGRAAAGSRRSTLSE